MALLVRVVPLKSVWVVPVHNIVITSTQLRDKKFSTLFFLRYGLKSVSCTWGEAHLAKVDHSASRHSFGGTSNRVTHVGDRKKAFCHYVFSTGTNTVYSWTLRVCKKHHIDISCCVAFFLDCTLANKLLVVSTPLASKGRGARVAGFLCAQSHCAFPQKPVDQGDKKAGHRRHKSTYCTPKTSTETFLRQLDGFLQLLSTDKR